MGAKEHNTDIIVVGGGIAGLTLAALLDRAGIDVHLIDIGAPEPLKDTKATGRTVALMESSLNIIRATGVWDKVTDFANPLQAMRIIDDSRGESIDTEFPASDIGQEQFGFNVPNTILRAALYEVVQDQKNITLHIPNPLKDYTVDGARVSAALDDGTVIHGALIVGADGRGSPVRKIAGIECASKKYTQSAITCLINHSKSHGHTATEFHRPSGPLAFVPMPGNQSSVVWVENTDRADEIMRLKKDEFVQHLEDKSKNILGGITLEAGPECWPLGSLRAKELTAPRTALVAEAAHVMSPITAQGLNLSLRDIAALAETIVDAMRVGIDPGSKAALDQYKRRRKIDITTRVFGVDSMNRIVSNDIDMVKGVRRLGLKTVEALPPLKAIAMRTGLAPKIDQGRLARGEAL